MMKLKRKAGLTAGVLAGVTMLVAPAAFATNTLSVDGFTLPPADINFTALSGSTVSFGTDSLSSVQMSCSLPALWGTVRRGGSVTTGMQIGKITNVDLGSAGWPCLMTSLNYPVLFEKSPASWLIVVAATPAKGSATVPIRIDNIDMKMQSPSKTGTPARYICDLRVRGSLTGTFNQTTQQMTINPPTGTYPLNNVEAYDGTGTSIPDIFTCAGQIWTGDSMRMTGAFTLSTPLGGGIHW